MEKRILDHFNDSMFRLEEIFYHELSSCARPKSDLVGIDFLQSEKIDDQTLEKLMDGCAKKIKTNGLVENITYSVDGCDVLLQLQVTGCIHLTKEIKLKNAGIAPYCCPIANMILDRIIELLHYVTTYTADIRVNENENKCTLRCGIFKTIDKIGEVSDWNKAHKGTEPKPPSARP